MIPKVDANKFAIIRAEFSTGKVLNNDDTYYNSAGNNYYLLFNSLREAKEYASREIFEKRKQIDITIYNHNAEFVEYIKPK